MSTLRQVVGNNIKELRERHGLSQGELAEVVGTSVKTIVSIEKGHAATNLDLLEQISKQLAVEPSQLTRNRPYPPTLRAAEPPSAVEASPAALANMLAALTRDDAEFDDIANAIKNLTGGRISLALPHAKNKLLR
jgi:DNA-binding XRE family transcriptional regulator